MNQSPDRPGLRELSLAESRETLEQQAEICQMLDNTPDLDLSDFEPEDARPIQIHIITCRDRVHKVSGFPTNYSDS